MTTETKPVAKDSPRKPAHFPSKKAVPLPYVVGDSFVTADGRIVKLVAENDWQYVPEKKK